MNISLDKLENIMKDIKNDDGWVNDSHSHSEYIGGINAMKKIKSNIVAVDDERKL